MLDKYDFGYHVENMVKVTIDYAVEYPANGGGGGV